MMQSPPTRTNYLVRVGGLCTTSTDFNRVRYLNEANIVNQNSRYLVSSSDWQPVPATTIHTVDRYLS